MILNRLQQAVLQSRFVGIYNNTDRPTVFAAGRARVCNEEITILSSVTKDGLEDGIAVRATPFIFKMEEDTHYLKSLDALWQYYGAKISEFEGAVRVEAICSFHDLFAHCRRVGAIVSLWSNNDLINEACGTVANVQDGFLLVNLLAPSGESDGCMTLRVEDVQSVNVGGFDERRRGIARKLLLSNEKAEGVRPEWS